MLSIIQDDMGIIITLMTRNPESKNSIVYKRTLSLSLSLCHIPLSGFHHFYLFNVNLRKTFNPFISIDIFYESLFIKTEKTKTI